MSQENVELVRQGFEAYGRRDVDGFLSYLDQDLGDRVLVFGRIRARGRESGLDLDSATGWVCTVRDGKLVKADGFLSQAEALEAAGLHE